MNHGLSLLTITFPIFLFKKICLDRLQPDFKKGSSRTFYGLTSDHLATCVVGLGKKNQGVDELEEIDQGKENVRIAAASKSKWRYSEKFCKIEEKLINDCLQLVPACFKI